MDSRLRSRVSDHLRRNVYGLLALFVALGGTAFAVQKAPKNSVVSKSIRNGSVKDADVNKAKVQLRIDGSCGPGAAISSIGQDGSIACDQGTPNGQAGGALAGTYPSPTIAPNAVGASQIADGSIASEDLGLTHVRLPETTFPLEEPNVAKLFVDEKPITGEERLWILWDDGDASQIAIEP